MNTFRDFAARCRADQEMLDREAEWEVTHRRTVYKSASLAPLLVLLLVLPGIAAKGFELTDNTSCTAVNRPWACCSGPAAGSCEGKAATRTVVKAHIPFEQCAAHWFDATGLPKLCDEIRFDIEWHVAATTCNQQEADGGTSCVGSGDPVSCCTGAGEGCDDNTDCLGSGDPVSCCDGVGVGTCPASLPVQPCNEARAEDGKCRSNLGCAALDTPWGCCTGLDTGTCPFTGSDNMPKQAACFKMLDYLDKAERKPQRQEGRKLWKLADDGGPFVPEDEPVE